MVEAGGKALRRLFGHPNVVGWTWYRWIGHNPLRSPRNCGLVDDSDEPHPWNVEGLAMVHPHAEHDRLAAAAAPEGPVLPFDGRLVVVLQRASILQSKAHRYPQKVVFGVEIRDGLIEGGLHGHGLEGRVADSTWTDGRLRLAVEIAFTDETFQRGSGRARYEVELSRRRGDHLTGRYSGTIADQPVAGAVSAWREPIPG